VFVDLLRFVAAFQMLQGHTVAALLAPTYRVGHWYAVWSAARGLTSVAFLFAAGLAFQIATTREYAAGQRSPSAVRARLLRALRLIVLGYLLHLPLQLLWNADPRNAQLVLERFVAVDVLQCIGVTMLMLEALAHWSSTPRHLAYASAAIGVLLLALGPLATDWSLAWAPRCVAAYFTSRTGSLFPLIPWSAHVFLGVACGALVTGRLAQATPRLMAALSAGLFASAAAVQWSAGEGMLCQQLWRLAWVVLVSALLARASRGTTRLAPWLQVLAAETLFLYVFHVLLVYGDGVGLADRIGARLSPSAAAAAALAVVLGCFAATLAYQRLRSTLVRKPLAA
jgi:uncharacterized membrane protein